MSGAVTAVAVLGTAYSIYAGEKAAGAQKRAQAQAEQNAKRQQSMADQAANKTNQKRADISGLLDAAQLAGNAGASSTMLTGPSGAGSGTLGSNTLLGG